MKLGEKGFTLVELVVAVAITVMVTGAAVGAVFQVFKNTERNNEYITVVRQVHNAGYWISRDTQMAQSVITDNLTLPDFFVLNWTEWDEAGEPIYHSVTYFFDDLADGIGELRRSHWSSAGASEQTLVAQYIYCDPSDVDNTSKASYQSPVLTLKLTSLFEETMETREYRITHRPNF